MRARVPSACRVLGIIRKSVLMAQMALDSQNITVNPSTSIDSL